MNLYAGIDHRASSTSPPMSRICSTTSSITYVHPEAFLDGRYARLRPRTVGYARRLCSSRGHGPRSDGRVAARTAENRSDGVIPVHPRTAVCWRAVPRGSGRGDAPGRRGAGGAVRGAREEGVSVFKGIPYAQPPVGGCAGGRRPSCRPGRACATRPASARPASSRRRAPAASMPTTSLPDERGLPDPQHLGARATREAAPVFVWIHGGALITGAQPRADVRRRGAGAARAWWSSRSTTGSACSAISPIPG